MVISIPWQLIYGTKSSLCFITGYTYAIVRPNRLSSFAWRSNINSSKMPARLEGISVLLTIINKSSFSGLQWGELFSSPSTESSRFAFGHVILMLLLDSLLYLLIALYLEQVLPGPYGTPKPWNFLFTKDFWVSSKNKYGGK